MPDILDVNLVPIEKKPENGELAEKIYYECMFCGKRVGLLLHQRSLCEKLSGSEFYCVFCLRNGFYTKNNRHVLMLSFRSIFGYYYYWSYLNTQKMYYSQIEDYINDHIKIGLENPVFSYDTESMFWFIDFSKVGRGNKKIKLQDVLKTVTDIITCLNLDGNLGQGKSDIIFDKFKEAIEKFYSARWRPKNKPALIPTLQGNMFTKTNFDETRSFNQDKMMLVF